jgi:formylmethanofuran dehydrogenase subunit C
MMKLILRPKKLTKIPIEADVINPDIISGKTIETVESSKVYQGNKTYPLSDFFKVEGEVADNPQQQMIVITGDVPHVKYIGKKMSTGSILVEGDAGMHTGSQMQGGELTVTGNTGDWTGAELKGGSIKIHGNAGNLLGAAYRGSSEGMTGGRIIVMGNVGSEAASFMRRGMLVIKGDTGVFTGVHMNGGEIIILGETGRRAGAQAKGNGGFIVCLGGIRELLPTYKYDTTYAPVFMRLYLKELSRNMGLEDVTMYIDTQLRRYRGDIAVGGNAEILVA